MYRRVISLILVAGIAIFANVGCNKQELADLKTQIANRDSTIVVIRDDNTMTNERWKNERTLTDKQAIEIDSLTNVIQAQKAENARLKKTVAQQKAKIDSLIGDWKTQKLAYEQKLTENEKLIADLKQQIASLQSENTDLKQKLVLAAEENRILKEWISYLKHMSDRGWFAKLFGADKIEPPKDPLPIILPTK